MLDDSNCENYYDNKLHPVGVKTTRSISVFCFYASRKRINVLQKTELLPSRARKSHTKSVEHTGCRNNKLLRGRTVFGVTSLGTVMSWCFEFE
jgi:hypothetical protein